MQTIRNESKMRNIDKNWMKMNEKDTSKIDKNYAKWMWNLSNELLNKKWMKNIKEDQRMWRRKSKKKWKHKEMNEKYNKISRS